MFLYCGGHHDSDRTAVLVWSPRLKLLYCKYHQLMYTLPNKDNFLPSFLPSSHCRRYPPFRFPRFWATQRAIKWRTTALANMNRSEYRQISIYSTLKLLLILSLFNYLYCTFRHLLRACKCDVKSSEDIVWYYRPASLTMTTIDSTPGKQD